MTITRLRAQRVPWPIPNQAGHDSCPLCGLSAHVFRHGHNTQRLIAHIAAPHARCKACGYVSTPDRMASHMRRYHRFPTRMIPELRNVA